jgi:hypothetical protein
MLGNRDQYLWIIASPTTKRHVWIHEPHVYGWSDTFPLNDSVGIMELRCGNVNEIWNA